MDISNEVRDVLVDHLDIKPEMAKPESKLTDDLGADSVDALEIASALEERFRIKISSDEMEKLTTVSDIVSLIDQKCGSKTTNSP